MRNIEGVFVKMKLENNGKNMIKKYGLVHLKHMYQQVIILDN